MQQDARKIRMICDKSVKVETGFEKEEQSFALRLSINSHNFGILLLLKKAAKYSNFEV